LLADAAADCLGVSRGSGLAAARMLAPEITLIARDPAREAAALQTLACWAGSLTPRLSLTTDTLLLEVGACLRLFGGLKKLARIARDGVAAQGFTVSIAAAPTPLAAHWLASEQTAACCLDHEHLVDCLNDLPVSVLPDKAAALLARFGLRRLADARRLPSADLAGRIGTESIELLARAYGEMPDPRVDFVFPEQFSQALELPAAVDNAGALLFAARRLTAALAGWLTARQAGVREARLCLVHREAESALPLQFAEPTADAGRFERVLRERLGNLVLSAPVEALRLDARRLAERPGRNQSLFETAGSGQEAVGALFERLVARLGEARVYRVAIQDDHRPECATRRDGLLATTTGAATGERVLRPRPLWLLDKPEALAEVDGRPWRRGHLKLLSGPERIESGWWDSGEMSERHEAAAPQASIGDLRRDYFIARAADAALLWIYRECRAPGAWFLHGFFS